MLIVQKGECEALPKIWSLRLICSANFAYLVLPAGSYLMTLFVYQALVRREVGLILEVAGGIGEKSRRCVSLRAIWIQALRRLARRRLFRR